MIKNRYLSLSMLFKFDSFKMKLNLNNTETALKLVKLSSFKLK